MPLKFYTFRQNNSGGNFGPPAKFIIIEAESATHANKVANSHDVYFDGVEEGEDCECCGDRWYPVSDSCGTVSPEIEGEKPPSYKGYRGRGGIPTYTIFYANGIEEISKD